ncbi:MAG: glycosyltransferase family 61 protein, partial [Rhodospirillales bacterium]|nr:glycosyltransferase family 61 protein [Rhodospirillales bacterium]
SYNGTDNALHWSQREQRESPYKDTADKMPEEKTELPIGQYLPTIRESGARSHTFFDGASLRRSKPFYANAIDTNLAPSGHEFTDLSFRTYNASPMFSVALEGASVIGTEGLVLHNGKLISDTVHYVPVWEEGVLAERVDLPRSVLFRRNVPLPGRRLEGEHFVGFVGAWRNHAHWLTDCVPRIYLYNRLKEISPTVRLLLPTFEEGGPQWRTLQLLGVDDSQITWLDVGQVVSAGTLWCAPGIDLWRPPMLCRIAAEALSGGLPVRDGYERIYIRRPGGRRVANFAEIETPLRDRGFRVVSFEGMTLDEQISIMRGARHVIGEHGAGVANVMFCRPGARLLEMFNPFGAQPAHWSLASVCDVGYGYLIGDHAGGQLHGNSDYIVPPDRLTESVGALLA